MLMNLVRHDWLDSTNEEAIRQGRAGATEGTVIVAEGQRAGRGREGRRWESPYGKNIYASIILRPPLAPEPAQHLTQMTALALAQAIEGELQHVAGTEWQGVLGLKWPNDILLHGRKLAGILTEATVTAGHLDQVVIGFGINVHMAREDFPDALQSTATSLALATGGHCDRERLLQSCLAAFNAWYQRFLQEGFAVMEAEYQVRLWTYQTTGSDRGLLVSS